MKFNTRNIILVVPRRAESVFRVLRSVVNRWRSTCGVVVVLLSMGMAGQTFGANAYPVFTDINAAPPAFGTAATSSFGGLYTLNSAAQLSGNDVLSINQRGGISTCCHGAQVEINVSNGENGVNSTQGGTNIDLPNPTPANLVFTAIGNPSGKLENGNVLRFSVWFRSDPANPITIEPQVAPILKFEFYKEALSAYFDSSAVQKAPTFGDRVFDQDQQGYAIGIPDPPSYVDIDGDGTVARDLLATEANGHLSKIGTDHWTLASTTYTVNTANWPGIGLEAFGANDVSKIESIRALVFMGEFASTNFSADGPDGGNLLVDNALVEVFRNANSVTPLNNPKPSVPEPSTMCMAIVLIAAKGLRRKRHFVS